MSTKPTRQQQHACEHFVEALSWIAEGARIEGTGTFRAADLTDIAQRLARASPAFGLDEIVSRLLERRCRALGLRAGSGDLLVLMEGDFNPLETMLLPDDQFKGLVSKLEADLGEI